MPALPTQPTANQSELIEALGAEPFERERRYMVFKLSDVRKYLSREEIMQLYTLANNCDKGRLGDGRPLLECVCVEHDWPEYEPTWAAIEKRMRGL